MSAIVSGHGPCQHYREGTALGISLVETLDYLIQSSRITPVLALKVLANFDVVVGDVLRNDAKETVKIRAKLLKYNWVDDVLSFKVSGKLTMQGEKWQGVNKELELKNMRMIAMRAHDAVTATQRPG